MTPQFLYCNNKELSEKLMLNYNKIGEFNTGRETMYVFENKPFIQNFSLTEVEKKCVTYTNVMLF